MKLNNKIITVNDRLMHPLYIRVLHVDLEYFYEYTCNLALNLTIQCDLLELLKKIGVINLVR